MHINSPDPEVVSRITKDFSQYLLAAVFSGAPESCYDLYVTVKELPRSFTRGVIEKDAGVLINGPFSLAQPNLLIAFDVKLMQHVIVKLLRLPQFGFSVTEPEKKDAIEAELDACRRVSELANVALVKCEVVEVCVQHTDDLDVAVKGKWAAIKMKRFFGSLTDLVPVPEHLIQSGFERILDALKAMHSISLVHMDVKSDNVFIDENGEWNLGDFGSTRPSFTKIWTYTDVLMPFVLKRNVTVIPSMDYVLLCVMIAVEMRKKTRDWKVTLCGDQQKVQIELIKKTLTEIENELFRRRIIEIFDEHFASVQAHLQQNQEQL